MVDGDQQPVLRNAEILGQQFPGEGDGLFLEIVAEAEIAQHFEEGVVARGIADIVEVVVLAARAHAFLRGGGAGVVARFDPGEQVLELHHARIGEHQRRVVARHQRAELSTTRWPLRRKEIEEGGADIVQRRHVWRDPLGRQDCDSAFRLAPASRPVHRPASAMKKAGNLRPPALSIATAVSVIRRRPRSRLGR